MKSSQPFFKDSHEFDKLSFKREDGSVWVSTHWTCIFVSMLKAYIEHKRREVIVRHSRNPCAEILLENFDDDVLFHYAREVRDRVGEPGILAFNPHLAGRY